MAQKHILSLGFDFPAANNLNVEQASLISNRSLCDADIIVFRPILKSYFSNFYKFQENKNIIFHWRQELYLALKDGKNIFVFLCQLEKYQQRDNYNLFFSENISGLADKTGSQIKIHQNLGSITTYWNNFAKYSKYQVYFDLDEKTTILKTKTGNKAVGAVIPVKKGNLILLPDLEFDEELVEYDEDDNKNGTDVAISHGQKLKASLIEIDQALSSGKTNTPPPEWTKKPSYKLASELGLEESIVKTNKKIDELQQKLNSDQAELEKQGHLKWLLYETGKPLEVAIIEALKIMGFSAENYEDDESEFDAVFVSEEGRFIGEAEGKNNKAINISKLSQLERELQEDFAREEVTEYAKGVLFGNAYRLEKLELRKEFFTDKCISGAKRSKIALIKTPDLFSIAKYLKENSDSDFAKRCRQAIADTEGKIVEFPNIP